MFDWVPIQNYTAYFDIFIFICILIILWQSHSGSILKKDTAGMNATWGVFLTVAIILYMGLRPLNGAFGDTLNYAKGFEVIARSKEPFHWIWKTEWLFDNLNNFFAKYSEIHTFFLLCATLYILPLSLACYRIFKGYYYVPLVVIFCMFTFWTYGVNGIRNGIGASLFILAITYANNKTIMTSLIILALGFHTSIILMAGAALVAWFVKNSYYYLIGWITCLALSYAVGGRIQTYLSSLSFMQEEERFSAYLTGSNQFGEVVFTTMTFRWDFVLYSAIGVAVGYYFIFKRNYKDEYYNWLYNIYLTTNAFWLLVIRANFSNRFAQISWFILPLVLVYPFMKKRFWANHEKMLAIAILVFYAFGFYTNIIKTNALSILF